MRDFFTPASMGGQPYHTADGTLRFEPKALRIVVRPGDVREGTVTVRGREGEPVRGFAGASGCRMQCVTEFFSGNPDRILWKYDASVCRDKETESGFLRVFSNHGEYRIPFEVLVQEEPEQDPQGQERGVRELGRAQAEEHPFAAAARRDWDGAVRHFYMRSFGDTLKTDREKLLWRGLSVYPGNEQNVEEYLLSVCGKKPVYCEANCKEVHAEIPWGMVMQVRAEAWTGKYAGYSSLRRGAREERDLDYREIPLRICRSGWGFTQLDVRCFGDFFENEGVRLTKEDFYSDVCEVKVRVSLRRLHVGRNFGRIELRSAWQHTSIPVEIYCRNERENGNWNREVLLVSLVRAYERLRLGRVGSEEWVRQTQEILRRLSIVDRNGTLQGLYQTHLLLMQGRVHAAILELESVRRKLAGVRPGEVLEMGFAQYQGESDTEFSYRVFLTAAAYQDEEVMTPRAIRLLRDRYRKNPGEWRIAWMLLQLSGEYAPGSSGRWLFLQRQFVSGSRSPILYLEAWEMVKEDPSVLNLQRERQSGRFDGDAFEQHLLLYALRKGLLTEKVMLQVMEMASRRRNFSSILFQVLTGAYETDSLRGIKPQILQTICSMLIRCGISDPDYFVWFSRAVERGIPVMRLADYYLQSMPEGYHSIIPDSVMREASPAISLPIRGRDWYYRYLYENRRRFARIYEDTLPAMSAYLQMQAQRGKMTQDLAIMYQAALSDPDLGFSDETKEEVRKLSYTCLLRTTRLSLKKAVILYSHEKEEKTYPVDNGNCTLPVFGEDNCILFEDENRCRYAESVPYTLDRMMEPVQAQQERSALVGTDVAYAMEISGVGREDFAVTAKNVAACEFLAVSDSAAPAFRARLQLFLMRYYAGRDPKSAEKLLPFMDPAAFSLQEQSEMAGILCRFGLYDDGIRWLLRCGTKAVPREVAAALICGAADKSSGAFRDNLLTELALEMTAASLKEDSVNNSENPPENSGLLKFLLTQGDLLADEREQVIRAAEKTQDHAREIFFAQMQLLRQILFTGEITPQQPQRILLAIGTGGDYAQIGQRALEQYLSGCFAGKYEADTDVLRYLAQTDADGGNIPDIGRLVLLRTAAQDRGPALQKNRRRKEILTKELLRRNFRVLVRKGIVFPFFREFDFAGQDLSGYRNETLIEYHDPAGSVKPAGHVVIHFAQERGGRQEPFRAREMKEMVRGFYVSSFYLFFGEQLHYFITDDAEEKNIAESGTISRDLRDAEGGGDRFSDLDSLTELAARKNRKEALEAFQEYRLKMALVDAMWE